MKQLAPGDWIALIGLVFTVTSTFTSFACWVVWRLMDSHMQDVVRNATKDIPVIRNTLDTHIKEDEEVHSEIREMRRNLEEINRTIGVVANDMRWIKDGLGRLEKRE